MKTMDLNARRQRKTVRDLRELIRHMWVHNGYGRNGYRQMTTEQKRLFDRIVGNTMSIDETLDVLKRMEGK